MSMLKKVSICALMFVLGIASFFPFNGSAATSVKPPTTVSEALKPVEITDIQYAVNRNLSQAQIEERFTRISSSYEVNQPFSAEDAEFVRAYATPYTGESVSASGEVGTNGFCLCDNASKSFSTTKSADGVSAKFSGTVRGKIGLLTHSYGGRVTTVITSGSSRVKSIKNYIKGTAYGAVGNGGTYIGIVHSSSVTGSASGAKATSWYLDRTKEYGAVAVLYVRVNAYTVINTPNGSFDVYAF